MCADPEYSRIDVARNLKIPLCVRTVTMSPVPVCAKVSLQRKCKKYLCAGERLSRDMWHVLDFAGMFSRAMDEQGYPAVK